MARRQHQTQHDWCLTRLTLTKTKTEQNNIPYAARMRCNYCEMTWYRFTFFSLSLLDCFTFQPASAPLLIYEWRFDRTWFNGRFFISPVLLWCSCYSALRIFFSACSCFDDASFWPVPVPSVLPVFDVQPIDPWQDRIRCLIWDKPKNVMANWYQTNCTSTNTSTATIHPRRTVFLFLPFSPPFLFPRFPPLSLLFYFYWWSSVYLSIFWSVCLSLLYSFCFALARSALGSSEYWVIIYYYLTIYYIFNTLSFYY